MFIFTTKFNKKKAILAILVLAAVLIAIVLIAGNTGKPNAKETAALSAVVKNNEQRVNYLKALGWEVEQNALEQQNVVIPRQFSDVYKNYNKIQLSQGFDLTKYGGVEAERFTYKVLNYPDATGTVVADIIIYKNEVIAGDVQSNALDGFMQGLQFPVKATPTPSPTANKDALAPEVSDSGQLTADEVLASEAANANGAASDTLPENDAQKDTLASAEDVSADTPLAP